MSKLKHDAYNEAMADYDAELIQQKSLLAICENRGDTEGMAKYLKEMAAIEVQKQMAHQIAVHDARAMRSVQPQNRYGLSADEVQIAKDMASNDRELSAMRPDAALERRMQIYAEQKAKYQQMRQTGEYRDDQGTVRR